MGIHFGHAKIDNKDSPVFFSFVGNVYGHLPFSRHMKKQSLNLEDAVFKAFDLGLDVHAMVVCGHGGIDFDLSVFDDDIFRGLHLDF